MNLAINASVGKAAAKLDLVAGRFHDASGAFNEIVDDVVDAEAKLFRTSRGWPQDKKGTLRQKAKKGQDLRPLRATGAAETALTTRPAPGTELHGQKVMVENDQMEFGIDSHGPLFYMRFQKKHGRDPLISRALVGRIAKKRLGPYFSGQ